MKKLFRKSSTKQTRRQRLRAEPERQKSTSFSYHGRRSEDDLNIDRGEQRESGRQTARSSFERFWLHRFGAIILLIALIVSTINILSLNDSAKIVTLVGSKPFLRSTASYQTAADKLLKSSFLNRNKITLDSNHIRREMLQQFPELSQVSVTVPLLAHRPVIYVQAAGPAIVLVASNGSFILSSSGKALASSSLVADLNALQLPQIGDQSGVKVTVNQQSLPSDSIAFVEKVSTALAAKNIPVSAMTLPAGASELDVTITGQPFFIKFNLQSNTARQQVGTYLATISQLQHQGITPNKYIDVRVDGRSYYQ